VLGRFPETWATFPSPRDSKLIREDFVFSEMDRGKIFERLVMSSLAEILPLFNSLSSQKVAETGLGAA